MENEVVAVFKQLFHEFFRQIKCKSSTVTYIDTVFNFTKFSIKLNENEVPGFNVTKFSVKSNTLRKVSIHVLDVL